MVYIYIYIYINMTQAEMNLECKVTNLILIMEEKQVVVKGREVI